ncbi:MAG TPA: hypothetical protein VLC93_04835, partial [Myxococcota bacterium]|nr:hypothetical protein [Myxococcota bacterium]
MSHQALLPLRFGGLVVCLFVSVVGCSGQAEIADVQLLAGGDGTAWWEGDGTGQVSPGNEKPNDGPSAEVCDGLDNDLDGTADEDLGGEPCTGASGAVGVWTCTAGEMVCFECTPGEVNDRGCGCGEDTADACNDSGRWIAGVCNGCKDLDEAGCGVDAACKPGEERIQRCDLCAGTG